MTYFIDDRRVMKPTKELIKETESLRELLSNQFNNGFRVLGGFKKNP